MVVCACAIHGVVLVNSLVIHLNRLHIKGYARSCQVMPGCARLLHVITGYAKLLHVVSGYAKLLHAVIGYNRLIQVRTRYWSVTRG